MPQHHDRVEAAYHECLARARSHYENFPVASWLLPHRLRRPVAAVYAFARQADDLADEGGLEAGQRLAALQGLGRALDRAVAGAEVEDPVLIALADTIRRHALPVEPFHHLLRAFRQDVTKTRYADFGEVMQYCRYSANPVGRVLLHLAGEASPQNLAYSDAVCSALQLINFYQDLAQDYAEMGRIYLPADEMRRYGVGERHLRERISDGAMRRLMQHQYRRADRLLRAGAPLGRALRGRFGLEVRMIILGGARILYRLQRQQDDVFSRPRLRPADAWAMLRGALLPPRRRRT